MGASELFFLIFAVLGGLALFIYGMNIMTDGLRTVAGQRLRSILSVMTTRRLSGLAMGTVLGTLIHSSAATVMLVGFIQAGLMNLIQARAWCSRMSFQPKTVRRGWCRPA